jgi:hypothetical protein|tara:strand:- start:53 stop:226 length:174 start_codon:yes stop_codon:yes gene_type:complete
MKQLLLLTAVFLTACGPSHEELAAIDEIDRLAAVEKARVDPLTKTETEKAPINLKKP